MIKYLHVHVDSDMQKLDKHEGSLREYAAIKLSDECRKLKIRDADIISIESSSWSQEMRPVMCNSATWYNQSCVELSVWYKYARL